MDSFIRKENRIMNHPSEIYENIIARTPAELKDEIMTILLSHRGMDHRISRRELVSQACGIKIGEHENLANNPYDRQVRELISELQRSYPILSSSGEGGYWMGTPAEISAYAAEIDSRATKLLEKSRRLRDMAEKLSSEYRQAGLGL
jgi:hypothetical protein